MSKVILDNGQEFELVGGGISEEENNLKIKILPNGKSVDQLFEMWNGNSTITVKDSDISVRAIHGFSVCKSVNFIFGYLVDSVPVCPECKEQVNPDATTCPHCKATFESPEFVMHQETICEIVCKRPDVYDRLKDAEESIEDLINAVLG